MDSLANYGSDDEYEENANDKLGTPKPERTSARKQEADANYENVQMELSEESTNSGEEEHQRQQPARPDRKRDRSGSRSRENHDSKSRQRRERSEERNFRRREDERRRHERRVREDKNRRKPAPGGRERKRSASKERKRSGSKERRRSGSRERRRSGSRDRRRSPRRDYRRRSGSKDRMGGGRFGKRFDRTSNKMAQLEKLGIEIKTPDSEFVTPQMLLQRSLDEQVKKVKDTTGIDFPAYYNPVAMNPARYADQIQKRRLLWQKKPVVTEVVSKPAGEKVWEQTTFAQDSDGKVASKFKRLMGIKEEAPAAAKDTGKDSLRKQEEMFSSMEQQYEVARTATHTMRGVGLGFGSYTNYPR